MGIFDRFPHSSTHEMNLDFMLGKAEEIADALQEVTDGLTQINTQTAAAAASATLADQRANAAGIYATNAYNSKEDAETASTTAAGHVTTTGTYMAAAQGYKNDAAASAAASAASAETAGQYVQAAGSILQQITTDGQAQVAAIEAKGAETLESIPDDYTALSNALSTKFELDNETRTQLVAGDNIDSLAIGNYYAASSTVAASLNLPFGTPGSLTVMTLQNSQRFLQLYCTTTNIAFRYNNGSTWSDWESVTKLSQFPGILSESVALIGNESATSISSATDLDSITTLGAYLCESSSIAESLSNSPSVSAFRMLVFALPGTSIAQFIVDNASIPKCYYRAYRSSIWSSWTQFVWGADLNKYETMLQLDNQKSTALTSGSTLDSLAVGSYFVSSSTIAAALSLPNGTPGRLYVMSMNNSARFIQLYFTTDNVAIRYYGGSTWSDWEFITKSGIASSGYTLGTTTTPTPFTDFDDAPDNGIYAINRAQYTNAPPGDNTLYSAGAASGYLRGTLMTYTQSVSNATYKVQLFVGYYSAIIDTPPIMAYRFAIKNNNTNGYDWSPWGKISEPHSLHTTNIVIHADNASNYFTDLNDAPLNSMYQIDLDCVEGVLAHHPAPGYSAVLHTFAWSTTSRHAIIQKLYSLQNSVLEEYTRYGYQNTSDDYRWTDWRHTITEAIS